MSEGVFPNSSKPQGKGFLMKAYCDSGHAGEKLTFWSRYEFVLMLDMAPIFWVSNNQISVEMRNVGSDCVALKQ